MPEAKKSQKTNEKEVKTTIKCPKCGHEFEVSVEIASDPTAPKMGYQG